VFDRLLSEFYALFGLAALAGYVLSRFIVAAD
jgi:hypothetical protein